MHSAVRRILVVTKYRFIGDTLTAVPTFKALKERWPNARIGLLSGARACELLQHCPYVDDFFEFDPYRAHDKGLRQYVKLLSRLRKEQFDLAIVLNRSFHSALTASLGGAKRRAGWRGFEGRDFLLTDSCDYDRQKSEIDCYLDIYRTVGGDFPVNSRLQIWLTNEELDKGATFLPEGAMVVGIQPGATHEYKQWPTHYFVELCEKMTALRPDVRFVLIGGNDEKPVAQRFLAAASPVLKERTVDLVGTLPLRITLAVVAQLAGFIGNDTAIRHASVALDVPSVGLFGPTSCSKWGNAMPPRHSVLTSSSDKMSELLVDDVWQTVCSWPADKALCMMASVASFDKQDPIYAQHADSAVSAIADVKFVLERSRE